MIDQVMIALTGVISIWLVNDHREGYRRFACLFGLAGQPFWFYSAISTEQWGVLALAVIYTLAWMRGVWVNWVR